MTTLETKRDLHADLAICDAATAGEWKFNGNEVVVTSNPLVGIAGAMGEEDCEFIAEARQGWPEAIRRAIAAEAEVERLRSALSGMVSAVDSGSLRKAKMSSGLDYVLNHAKEALSK